jgi:RNA polymerase sigma factor (sigma-70 family)
VKQGSRLVSHPVLAVDVEEPGRPVSDVAKFEHLTAWFSEWHLPLRKYLSSKRYVQTPDIDDVAQEVFLRLLRYDRVELIEHPQAYLYKMAGNVAAEWAIRARNTQPHQSKWLTGLSAPDLPENLAASAQVQEEIARGLCLLTGRQREVLRLLIEEGLTHAEIAAKTGNTTRSVKRLIIKSYEKLRYELDEGLLGVLADARK